MALHYDDDTDVNGDDLSGFGLWLAALHDDHDDDDDNDDLYKMVKTTSVLMMLNPENTLLNQCHAPKALFKVPKICNLDFWIEITPPLNVHLESKHDFFSVAFTKILGRWR